MVQNQLAWSKGNLKYPLYLFLAIFFAKVGYVAIESFYNYYVLFTTTSANLTKESVEELNANGHRISSVGITLLLVPLFYFFVKNYSAKKIYITLAIATFITYNIVYQLLNYVVEDIVKINKEKRHDAYYVNVFKYGVLNNIFSYDSFIDHKLIENGEISVKERLLLTNTFLLLHADESLIAKLKERGKNIVADFYIQTQCKEDYELKFAQFKDASDQVGNAWNDFNSARIQLDSDISELKELMNEQGVKKAHNDLINTVQSRYKEYEKAWQKVDEKISAETTPSKLESIQDDLNKYFKYQSNKRAQDSYENTMNEKFGYYIEPDRWRNFNSEVTHSSITKVIKEELVKKAQKSSQGVPYGLSPQEFINHIDVKVAVSKELKDKGIDIPYDFDYTLASFSKYYSIPLNKKHNEATTLFYKKLNEKIGKNDIKLSFTWEDFVTSKYIRDKLNEQLKDVNENDKTKIVEVIISKDLGNFKKMIYLPKVIDKANEILYKAEDFADGAKAEKIGDDAIKLLYIPPFALAVSILALLLNFVTVIGMMLQFSQKFSPMKMFFIKLAITFLIVVAPFTSSMHLFENELLSKIDNSDLKTYISFLKWISYYEQLNANLHK